MTLNLNVFRSEIITSLLITLMLSNCQSGNRNATTSKDSPVLESEEDCGACADYFMNGPVQDFDSMISCGKSLVECGSFLTGWDFLSIGFTHTGQLDSSDHYADLVINYKGHTGDSLYFYRAISSKALNEYFGQHCPEDDFKKFDRVWTKSPNAGQKKRILPYYAALLYTCKSHQKSLSICDEGLRKFSSELDSERLAYIYEIMALNHQEIGNPKELVCKYLDSSIQIAPVERTLQKRQEICK